MKNETKLTRRNFLMLAGAGGAAGAAAIATRTLSTEKIEPVTKSDERRGKGYQETAHVRSYYNTAKV